MLTTKCNLKPSLTTFLLNIRSTQAKSIGKGKKKQKQDDEQVLAILKTPGRSKRPAVDRSEPEPAQGTTSEASKSAEDQPAKKAKLSSSSIVRAVKSKAAPVRVTRSRANNDTLVKPANPFAPSASKKSTTAAAKSKTATQKKSEADAAPVTRRKRKSEELIEEGKQEETLQGADKRKKTLKGAAAKVASEKARPTVPDDEEVHQAEETPTQHQQPDVHPQQMDIARPTVGAGATTPSEASVALVSVATEVPSDEAPKPKRGLSISKKSLGGANTSTSYNHAIDGDKVTKHNTEMNALQQSAGAVSSVEALRNRLESVGAKRQSVLNGSTPALSTSVAAETRTKQKSTLTQPGASAVTSPQTQTLTTQSKPSSAMREAQAHTTGAGIQQAPVAPTAQAKQKQVEEQQAGKSENIVQTETATPVVTVEKPPSDMQPKSAASASQSSTLLQSPARPTTSRLPLASPSKNATGTRSPTKSNMASGGSTWAFGAKIKGFFGLQGPPPPAMGMSAGAPGPIAAAQKLPASQSSVHRLLDRPSEAAVKKPVAAAPPLRQPLPSTQNKIPQRKPQDQGEARKVVLKPIPASSHSSVVDGKKRAREPELAQAKSTDPKVLHKKLKAVGPTLTASGSKPSTAAARPPVRPSAGIARPAHSAASATAASAARSVSVAKSSMSVARPGPIGTANSGVSRPPLALPSRGPASAPNEKVQPSPAVISGVRPPPIARKPTAENLRAVNAIMNASVRPPTAAAAPKVAPKPAPNVTSSIKPVQKPANPPQAQAPNRIVVPQSGQRKTIPPPSPTIMRDEDIMLPDVASE